MRDLFKDHFSKINKVMYIGHQKRELTIVDNLSVQPDREVKFSPFDDPTGVMEPVVNITYKNVKQASGRICVLAQGIKKGFT